MAELSDQFKSRLDNQLARWYKLKDHPVQLKMIHDQKRFKCVPAGRRSGKTERFKRFMAKKCMMTPNSKYFIAAPTSAQVKKIYWDDMKKLSLSCLHKDKPSETDKIIFFPNNTQLHFASLDKPDRIEGINWDGGGIDEFASTKPDAWNNLSPLFDTINPQKPGYKPWCWFLGVPDGLNHYYELCQNAELMDDWGVYSWPSSDILPADIIVAARARMSAKQFRQEYEASFETVSGRIYEDYGKDNYTDELIQAHEEIHYFCDFNFTPMSHGVAVIRKNDKTNLDDIYVLDNIILTSARGYMNVTEFCEKYKNHINKHVFIYGDPSGKIGENHSIESEYVLMEREFHKYGWTTKRRIDSSHPSIKDRHNAVNAMIKNALGQVRLYVNPKMAQWMHKGFHTTSLKNGSTFQEDQSNEFQHITTAVGYMIYNRYPVHNKHDFEKHRIISPWGLR